MCLIHFNSIIQPFSLALTFWKNGETLKLFSMVFSGTYAPLTSCFPHHIWALVDQMLRSMDPRSHLEESMKPWFLIWRELLWTQDFLWDAYFSCFFHKMSQCGTFEVTLFSAISGGNDWMNYGSVLRLGHRGSISCLSDPFGIGSPDHKKTPRSRPKRRCWAKAWRGVLRDFCPLISQKKTAELRDIPWCLAEF
jgi:hypothetical protein